MTAKKNALEELQNRKTELALKCKAKAEEISRQTDYITEHIGEIAIKCAIKNMLKKDSESKTSIVKLLVTEGIGRVFNSTNRKPDGAKDKVGGFFIKALPGLLNLLLNKR